MRDLVFVYGDNKNLLRVRVVNNRVYFVSLMNGNYIVKEISEVLKHMSDTKAEGKEREELLEKIKIMEEILKSKKEEYDSAEYVIKELESIGMVLKIIERKGFRPQYIRRGSNAI